MVTGLLFTLDKAACTLHSFSRRKVGPEAVFPDLSVKILVKFDVIAALLLGVLQVPSS